MIKIFLTTIFILSLFICGDLIAYDNRSECTPACNNRYTACLKSIDKRNNEKAKKEKQKCTEQFKECTNHCNRQGPSIPD